MAKVTGELGAVVGGTEQATQQILEAAEAIDQAASALVKVDSADQQAQSEPRTSRNASSAIFEACNFQDLTGQRISKVMTTMKFIEQHINVDDGDLGRRRRHQGPCARADRRPRRVTTPSAQRPEARRRRRPRLAGRHRRDVRLSGDPAPAPRRISSKRRASLLSQRRRWPPLSVSDRTTKIPALRCTSRSPRE